jgi:hypothetical protein
MLGRSGRWPPSRPGAPWRPDRRPEGRRQGLRAPDRRRAYLGDEDEAERALDACLDRIGRLCQDIPDGIYADQALADLEESINIAAQRQNRAAFDQALGAYEAHCMSRYMRRGPQHPREVEG